MTDISLENQNEKNKSPLLTSAKILFLVAVAIIIYLLAKSCTDSRSQLESTRAGMIRERDSLLKEIRKVEDHFASLQTQKDNLIKALEKENETNNLLVADKAATNRQLARSNGVISGQNDKINNLTVRNDSLLTEMEDLQSKMDELNYKITGLEKEVEVRNNNISDLNNTVSEKETKITEVNDAMNQQHITDSLKVVPKFITSGDLMGGWGMNTTDVPYSHYFLGGTFGAGMEFNKRFYATAGTGAYFFNGGTLMPVFLEFRYGFPAGTFTPYIYMKGGPLINFSSYDKSNLFLSAGIGLRHQISDNFAMNFGTGLFSHNSGGSGRDSFLTLDLGIIYTKKDKAKK